MIWPFSVSSASILGAIAPIAEEPQTAFPPAIIRAIFSLKPNLRPIVKAPMITVVIISTIKIRPLSPIWLMVWKVTVKPNRTTEYSSRRLSENLVPLAKLGCLKKVFPKSIPNRIANVAAPSFGSRSANSFAPTATARDKPKPGSNVFIFMIVWVDMYIFLFMFGRFSKIENSWL